ncbi:MAG: PaaI family thioesterase [Candidatus Rokuibacteriota bacterium]
MPKALDVIRMVQRGEAAPPPIADLIGFTLTEIDPGRAVVALEAGPRHANPMGTLHGGILCDTTLELKINFLRPVRTGRVECDVVDDKEHLVARAVGR